MAKTHGGMSSDGAWYVAQTTDGGFILTGWTLSYGPGALGNAWLVKTDSLGNQQWNKFLAVMMLIADMLFNKQLMVDIF